MDRRIGGLLYLSPNHAVIHIGLSARPVRLIHAGSAADLCDPPPLLNANLASISWCVQTTQGDGDCRLFVWREIRPL